MVTRVMFPDGSGAGGDGADDYGGGGTPNTPEGRDMILECASGWGEAATLLKFYIEHGVVYTPPRRG